MPKKNCRCLYIWTLVVHCNYVFGENAIISQKSECGGGGIAYENRIQILPTDWQNLFLIFSSQPGVRCLNLFTIRINTFFFHNRVAERESSYEYLPRRNTSIADEFTIEYCPLFYTEYLWLFSFKVFN